MSESVEKDVAKGAAWMMAVMIFDRAVGFISTLILARLLVPEDFGLVAMCTSVVAALQIFAAFSVDAVLIQRQDADRDLYDSAWSINIVMGLFVGGAVLLSAEPTAQFYDEPRLVLPMYLLAIGFFINSAQNIATVDFRKYMQFDREAYLRAAQKLSGFVVTIPLAFYLENYWALVIGTVAMNLFSVAISFMMKPYKPRFTLIRAREILSFSSWILLTNMTAFVRFRASDFIIGRNNGAAALGLFEISKDLASLPATQVVASINRAVYPGYSKLADQQDELRSFYLATLTSIAIVATPLALGIASVVEPLVPIMLGEGWEGSIPAAQAIAVYALLAALTTNSYYIFLANGEPRKGAILDLIQAAILIPILIWMTLERGIVGAAMAYGIAQAIGTPMVYFVVGRDLKLHIGHFLLALARPLLSGAAMVGTVLWFLEQSSLPVFQALLLAIALGAFVYVGMLLALAYSFGGEESVERKFIAEVIKPRLASWRDR